MSFLKGTFFRTSWLFYGETVDFRHPSVPKSFGLGDCALAAQASELESICSSPVFLGGSVEEKNCTKKNQQAISVKQNAKSNFPAHTKGCLVELFGFNVLNP